MTRSGSLLGAVSAGGESRRLGEDKAAAEVGGVLLVRRAYDVLAAVCDEVIVVSSRSDVPRGPWQTLPDSRDPCGPLGAIESALIYAESRGAESVFVLACDLPLVDSAAVEELVTALDSFGPTRPAVAAAREGDPDFEPLCAVYRVDCLSTATALLDRGERAAQALVREVGGEAVPVGAGTTINVNTPDDLAAAEAALQAGSSVRSRREA